MGDILNSFGVTWAKLIAQILIFLIVYLVLKKKAFGPILGMLEQRKARIAEGEQNLEKIRTDLEGAEANAKELVAEANAQAERIIEEANASAEASAEKKTTKAALEAKNIRDKAKEESGLERERLLSELKRDFGRMVVEATGKVSGKVLSKTDQTKINKEAATQVGL